MKKIYGFAALCAAMTLASCSNNDEPVVNPAGNGEGQMVTAGYLSVNIANPAGTRGNHDAYQVGTPAESLAKTATFVFLEGDGTYVTMSADQELTSTTGHTTGNIERDYTVLVPVGVVVEDGIDNSSEDAEAAVNKIKKVVVILNPTDDINAAVKDQNETQILSIAADYSTLVSDNEFVMTNSVYVDEDDNVVYGQSVDGKIQKSALDAAQNPVDLYVERVVARVNVGYDNNYKDGTAPEISVYTYDKDEKTYTSSKETYNIVVTGVEVANVAAKSYLVKNVDNTFDTFTDWNDKDAFRSHWADSWTKAHTTAPSRLTAEDMDFVNNTYATIDANNFVDNKAKFYINENTNDDYQTALVISAELQDEEGNGVTLYRTCRDGNYYNEDGAKAILLDMLKRAGYYVVDTENSTEEKTVYRNLEDADLTFKSDVKLGLDDAVGFEGYLDFVAETAPTVYQTTDGGVTFKTVANFVSDVLQSESYKVWKWDGGKCYYYVYLTNGLKDGDDNYINGVVRNHIYDVNITSIAGLGVPVFDPSDIIVPITPDKLTPNDEWSLACNIHILSWTRYTQNAAFNQGGEGQY